MKIITHKIPKPLDLCLVDVKPVNTTLHSLNGRDVALFCVQMTFRPLVKAVV